MRKWKFKVDSRKGGFPKINGIFLGAPIIRTVVSKGPIFVPPYLGNHQIYPRVKNTTPTWRTTKAADFVSVGRQGTLADHGAIQVCNKDASSNGFKEVAWPERRLRANSQDKRILPGKKPSNMLDAMVSANKPQPNHTYRASELQNHDGKT